MDSSHSHTNLCRDCLFVSRAQSEVCPQCGSDRSVAHEELSQLTIAHIDCDAFYAAVEKRDDPSLRDKPLLIGGGKRGVVATACYIARPYGPRSAMPMYKALKLCPHAVVMRPNMEKYRIASRHIRDILETATPLVEPVSVDEAYLDLSGTVRLHRHAPAVTLASIARDIEQQVGITVSIGLSYNKFLAKMASERDKPHGFAVIGRSDAVAYLHEQSIGAIPGVGPALANRLKVDGLFSIGDLQALAPQDLEGRYGDTGRHLARLSRGEDSRRITTSRPAKSISAERTFDRDINDVEILHKRLWPLCEEVSARLKAKALAGGAVTLKLKTARFRTLTRTLTLKSPTQLAEVLYRTTKPMLGRELKRGPFRLIGIGAGTPTESAVADLPDLLNEDLDQVKGVEQAMDAVRAKFGKTAIRKGRGD
ncbi:MAG: DNA polymerase IV [Rhodospirillaceae bacterium]|nr:DNA polymerase IV [Rhodospirillaceae bacterium]